MSSGRLRIGHAGPGSRILVAEYGQYNLNGRSSDLQYTPANQLTWNVHSPSYIPVIPGHSGYGMDTPGGTGRHLTTPATSIYLIDDLGSGNVGSARPELGTNVFSGTFQYCWRATASPKVIIPIISGITNVAASVPGQQGTQPTAGFFSYWGQFAPAPGFFIRNTKVFINGGGDVVVMHMRSYMGDDADGLGAGNRDPFSSGCGACSPQNIVLINNEFAWSVDELCDFYRTSHLVTWLYNAFINPLHDSIINHPDDPPDFDHGFGPMYGGDSESGQPGSFTFYRNLFAHISGRAPAVMANNFSAANNLYYNVGGRPGAVGNSEAIGIWSQATTSPRRANIVGNGFIRGPENTSSIVAVRVRSGGVETGTIGYMAGNAVHGWTANSQADLVSSALTGWQQESLVSVAWPGSWGSEAGGYTQIFEDPHNPTAEEWHAFVDLMDNSVGAQPAARTADVGRVDSVFKQIRDRLNGGSTDFQFINTVEEDGGWFDVPTTLIDPTDPGTHWHAPLPTGSGRDTPYTSGTFSNGLSRVGRSPLEVWAIEEHWRQGGK
jgi:hypothetical protein